MNAKHWCSLHSCATFWETFFLTRNITGGAPMRATAVESFLLLPPLYPPASRSAYWVSPSFFTPHCATYRRTEHHLVSHHDWQFHLNHEVACSLTLPWQQIPPALPGDGRTAPDVLVLSKGHWWRQTVDSNPSAGGLAPSLSAHWEAGKQSFTVSTNTAAIYYHDSNVLVLLLHTVHFRYWTVYYYYLYYSYNFLDIYK